MEKANKEEILNFSENLKPNEITQTEQNLLNNYISDQEIKDAILQINKDKIARK